MPQRARAERNRNVIHGDAQLIRCEICNRQYDTKVKYRQHMLGVHRIRVGANAKQYRCPIASCHQTNSCRMKYFEHLTQIHQIQIEQMTMTFHDYQEFFQWKKNQEKLTNTLYIKNQRIYKNKQQRHLGHYDYYYCSNSGYYNSKDKFARSNRPLDDVKPQAVKIGSLCPARIRVECPPQPAMLKVEFTKTHIGHEQSPSPNNRNTHTPGTLHCQSLDNLQLIQSNNSHHSNHHLLQNKVAHSSHAHPHTHTQPYILAHKSNPRHQELMARQGSARDQSGLLINPQTGYHHLPVQSNNEVPADPNESLGSFLLGIKGLFHSSLITNNHVPHNPIDPLI